MRYLTKYLEKNNIEVIQLDTTSLIIYYKGYSILIEYDCNDKYNLTLYKGNRVLKQGTLIHYFPDKNYLDWLINDEQ